MFVCFISKKDTKLILKRSLKKHFVLNELNKRTTLRNIEMFAV